MKKKYSFLCKGRDGYWIFEDIKYQVGKEKRFSELTDEQRNYLAIAHTDSGSSASLITAALNHYAEDGLDR